MEIARLMVQQDLFLTSSAKFWLWCKRKQQFSSVDIARYALANYYLRANRTCRDWSIPKEVSGVEPRLERIGTKEKLHLGLVRDGNQMIGWYRLNPKYQEEL